MKDDNYLNRIEDPRMEYYRDMYKHSPRWDGSGVLFKKRVIVYCEQGLGDIIYAARYFEAMRATGCRLYLHAQAELENLFLSQGYIDQFIHKGADEIPEHDLHTLSLSLPFLLEGSQCHFPYIHVRECNEDITNEYKDFFKIGITWEGWTRQLHLKHFKQLTKNPKVKLFMVQKEIRNESLLDECEDLELLGTEINDMLDTAKLINSMDLMISIDTSTLHLAGALNKKTFGLIEQNGDPRWEAAPWYPHVNLYRINKDTVKKAIGNIADYVKTKC